MRFVKEILGKMDENDNVGCNGLAMDNHVVKMKKKHKLSKKAYANSWILSFEIFHIYHQNAMSILDRHAKFQVLVLICKATMNY